MQTNKTHLIWWRSSSSSFCSDESMGTKRPFHLLRVKSTSPLTILGFGKKRKNKEEEPKVRHCAHKKGSDGQFRRFLWFHFKYFFIWQKTRLISFSFCKHGILESTKFCLTALICSTSHVPLLFCCTCSFLIVVERLVACHRPYLLGWWKLGLVSDKRENNGPHNGEWLSMVNNIFVGDFIYLLPQSCL